MHRLTVVLFILLCTPFALAWNSDEHQVIGSEAYSRACSSVLQRFPAQSDPGAKERLKLACSAVAIGTEGAFGRRSTFAYDSLAGEWSALAADHTRKPEELVGIRLGDIVADYRLFTRMAIENYKHFHPASVTAWRTDHLHALEGAVSASQASGIELIDRFEAALAIETFAQHYLQDSFASGHMGFNRVASSNSATLVYHNKASVAGRCVMNLNAEQWFTYGDDHLGGSPQGEEHVVATAALSFEDFLETFINGKTDTSRWQSVWSALPAYIEEPTTKGDYACSSPGSFHSLRTVSRPAEAVVTIDASTVSDTSLYRYHSAARGVMVGASHDFMLTIPIGFRVIQNRIFASVGQTIKQTGPKAWLFDYGYLWHVGTSSNGTVTHEIGFGQLAYWAPKVHYRTSSARLLYAANLEAGRVYLRFQAGAAYDYDHWGLHTSMGVGWVQRAVR